MSCLSPSAALQTYGSANIQTGHEAMSLSESNQLVAFFSSVADNLQDPDEGSERASNHGEGSANGEKEDDDDLSTGTSVGSVLDGMLGHGGSVSSSVGRSIKTLTKLELVSTNCLFNSNQH